MGIKREGKNVGEKIMGILRKRKKMRGDSETKREKLWVDFINIRDNLMSFLQSLISIYKI